MKAFTIFMYILLVAGSIYILLPYLTSLAIFLQLVVACIALDVIFAVIIDFIKYLDKEIK